MKKLKNDLWHRVCQIDLNPIRARLIIKKGWPEEKADLAILSYKHFLYLSVVYPGVNLEPTFDVDEVWHDHILHMKKYAADCHSICGRLIIHEPYATTESVGLDKPIAQITLGKKICFEDLSRDLFGVIPPGSNDINKGLTMATSDCQVKDCSTGECTTSSPSSCYRSCKSGW